MSNTDNMRVLAVVSTQLAHHQFISGDGSLHADAEPPTPMVVHDLGTKEWSDA
jgi:asparagine synthase (glutamine-hydrolysing)